MNRFIIHASLSIDVEAESDNEAFVALSSALVNVKGVKGAPVLRWLSFTPVPTPACDHAVGDEVT